MVEMAKIKSISYCLLLGALSGIMSGILYYFAPAEFLRAYGGGVERLALLTVIKLGLMIGSCAGVIELALYFSVARALIGAIIGGFSLLMVIKDFHARVFLSISQV